MTFKVKDFIEIEFTAKVKDGELFDSNIKEDLKAIKHQDADTAKPLTFCVGEKMFLESLEKFLLDKEVGKFYDVELAPEKAFGNRMPQLVKLIPIKVFYNQQINPVPGAVFNFDGQMAKIITVSGGRVITDFNNPLAGKTVIYKIRIIKKVEETEEKVKALMEFYFRKDFPFKIEDKKIMIHLNEKEAQYKQFLEMFEGKFKDILDLSLEIKAPEIKTLKEEAVEMPKAE